MSFFVTTLNLMNKTSEVFQQFQKQHYNLSDHTKDYLKRNNKNIKNYRTMCSTFKKNN